MASLASPSPSSTTTSRRGSQGGGQSRAAPPHRAATPWRRGQSPPPEACPAANAPPRHREGGEDHAAEGKQRDRPQIGPKFAPAHGDAGGIDQRRQDAEQHQFRRQLDARQIRQERERDAGDDQKDRRRGVEPLRHDGHDHQDGEKEQEGFDRRGQVLNPSFGLWRTPRARAFPVRQRAACAPSARQLPACPSAPS